MWLIDLEYATHQRHWHFDTIASDTDPFVLMGPSGSGKTTFAKLLMGLLTPQRGRLVLNKRVLFASDGSNQVPPEKRGLGVLFQEPRLLPHLSARENILLPIRLGNRQPRGDFEEIVEVLGIQALLPRYPHALSGGEKQRVALARALMATQEALILDEPLASLDFARIQTVLPFLTGWQQRHRKPMIYITHSPWEAMQLSSTVWSLTNKGTLEAFACQQRFTSNEATP